MKKITLWAAVLTMFLALRPAGAETNVEIYNFEGRVNVLRDGKIVEPGLDMPCRTGDDLRVEPDSMLDLSMNFFLGVRFFGPAECKLLDIEPGNTHLKMDYGTAMVNMKTIPSGATFEIETPTVVVSAKLAKFLVAVTKRPDKTTVTAVTVKIGTISVYIKDSSSSISVLENQHLEIAEDSFIPSARSATEEEMKSLDKVLSVYIVEQSTD